MGIYRFLKIYLPWHQILILCCFALCVSHNTKQCLNKDTSLMVTLDKNLLSRLKQVHDYKKDFWSTNLS